MFLRIFNAFFLQNCTFWTLLETLTIIFDVLEENIRKIIESWYIGICPIIGIVEIIDIENDRRIIENLFLSKKMAYRPPLPLSVSLSL